LKKRTDQFVVRALPDTLHAEGFAAAEKVSSGSSRVAVAPATLEQEMTRARTLAPTHHAYDIANSNQEFLITDRVLVTFRQAPTPAELGAFTARYSLIKQQAYSDREFLFQLTDHTGINPVKLVVQLNEQEPLVESADHDLNQRMSKYQLTTPTDPSYANQWHLHTHATAVPFDARASSRCGKPGNARRLRQPRRRRRRLDDGCRLDHPTSIRAAWAGATVDTRP
jgi:hypothetical protein